MSLGKSDQLADLREILQERRAQLKQLERERARISRQLETLDATIALLASKGTTQAAENRLFDAVSSADPREVRDAIKSGADPNRPNEDGQTPLLWAVQAANPSLSVIRALLDAGALVDAADGDGNTPLIVSVRDESLPVVEALVKHGADVNSRNKAGDTPLSNASCWGGIKVVTYLLKHGANPLIPDGADVLPVDLAREQGHSRIVKLLSGNRR